MSSDRTTPRRRALGTAVAATTILLLASSCSSGTGQTKEVKGGTSTSSTSASATTVPGAGSSGSTTSTVPPTTLVVNDVIVAKIGEPITTKDGNVVTVHSLQWPLDVANPENGKVYSAADIEACAAQDPKVDAGVAPGFFRVELTNKTSWQPVQPVKEPALQPTKLAPGRCARGWVSFSLPKNISPLLVTLRTSTNAAWRFG